jgi:hypothetical protein
MAFVDGIAAALRHFVRNLLRRNRVERELTDQIDGYLDLLIEEKVARGMSRDDARRTARLEIGRGDLVKEQVRDVRVGAWLHEPDRLTMVWGAPRFNRPRIEVAPLNYVDWEQQVPAFESLAAYLGGFVNLTGVGSFVLML